MKKEKLFLLAMSFVALPMAVSGQSTGALITSVDQLYSPYTRLSDGCDVCQLEYLIDGDPSTCWHSENSSSSPRWSSQLGVYYFRVELLEAHYGLQAVITRRDGYPTYQFTKFDVYAAPDDEAAKEDCEYLASLDFPFGEVGETLTANFETQGNTFLRFYLADSNEGSTITYIAEFQLYGYDSEFDKALVELMATLEIYRPYLYSFTEGTGPGEYDHDACEAFYAAILAVDVVDDPEAAETLTAEDLYQLQQNIIDTYEAVLASQVPVGMQIVDGYYFFISGGDSYTDYDEDGEPIVDGEGNNIVGTKAMYSVQETDAIYAKWNTLKETCPFLWKVTDMGDGEYSVVNVATGATFDQVHGSTSCEMVTDSATLADNLIVFEYGSEGYTDYVYMIINWQQGTSNHYLHCTPSGGSSGYVVGGNNTSASSRWYPTLVGDEDAQAIIDAYSSTATALEYISDAEEKMAIANSRRNPASNGLITSADQLSSPSTDSDSHPLSAIVDGSASTYWRTAGSSGVELGTQYFEVELDKAYGVLEFEITRRDYASNQFTELSVYGTSNPAADKSGCTLLAEIDMPYSVLGEKLTSDPFDSQGFTTLRFYIENTTNPSNGYSYIAEFQLFEYDESKLSQAQVMGDVYTSLAEAISVARSEIDSDDGLSSTVFSALEDAYNAFLAVFVDPTELRNALDEAEAVTGVVVGTDPGYWSDSSVFDELNSAIAEATVYDDSSVYTQAQTDAYLETIQSLSGSVYDAAIKVQPGKWYMIRYATEEEIEENGWNASNGAANDANESLYGKYITVATRYAEDDFNYVEYVTEADLSTICSGQALYFDDKYDLAFDDYAKFRFINVGDTAYMMQNKATGLFLTTNGTHASISLTPQPSLFDVSAIGYGENLFTARTLAGEAHNYLSAQLTYNLLITNTSTDAGSNSGFYIEDIGEDVANDYDGTAFNLALLYGSVHIYCYPVSLTANSAEGTMYGVEVDGTTVTLHPMEGNIAKAGQPFVYIYGDTISYDAEAEGEPVPFTHGYDIEREAQTSGALVGSYYGGTIGAGKLVGSGNTFAISGESTSLSTNRAYIDGDFSSADDITIVISDVLFDGVESVIKAVSQSDGNIYSVDGKLLGKGNLNTVKSLGKGIYIVNGVKVAVK